MTSRKRKEVVCKHQVELFFKVFSDEAENYKAELKTYYDYDEKKYEHEEAVISKFLDHYKKSN